MDDEARKAAFAEARAQSHEILERVADVTVQRRDYSEPDALEQWRRGMPAREPAMTAAKTAKMIAEQLAAHREIWLEVQAKMVSHERKRHRAQLDELIQEHASQIAKLNKLVTDDRRLARTELNRQRADHDRQRASMLAEIAQLRAKNAELELRLDSLLAHETKVIAPLDQSLVDQLGRTRRDLPVLPIRGGRRA